MRFMICELCCRGVRDGEDAGWWAIDTVGRSWCPDCQTAAVRDAVMRNRLYQAVLARLRLYPR